MVPIIPPTEPAPAGVSERILKSHSIAVSLFDRHKRLREIERVDNARRLDFNTRLQSRSKYLRHERRKVRRRIESLESEHRGFSAEDQSGKHDATTAAAATPVIMGIAQNSRSAAQNTWPTAQNAA